VLIADHRVSKGPEGPDAADGSNPEPQGLGARTRDRVRQAISEHGPIIVPALAFRLGLTPAAVRGRLHPTSRGDAAHGEHVCTTFIQERYARAGDRGT